MGYDIHAIVRNSDGAVICTRVDWMLAFQSLQALGNGHHIEIERLSNRHDHLDGGFCLLL